jgi:hypothetical protein
MTRSIDDRISFHPDLEIMEADFSDYYFHNSADVNAFYDRLEERIAETGEEKWFFLVNYSGMRIDPDAWFAFSRRGKMLNMAHSQGSVRFDVGEETRRQIERDAETERFDPNLFADRVSALARIAELPSKRPEKFNLVTEYNEEDFVRRLSFLDADAIMDVDFSDFTFAHSADVHAFYDFIEACVAETGRKWYFLVNYNNCRIYPEAWVSFAMRGKALNIASSLGSVRYATGSETEETIRMRAESQAFRPNIRNTRAEALERIAEMKRETA